MTHENMEALLSQFSLLTHQACQDKTGFDPATIDELMKLFETEAFNSMVAMDSDQKLLVEGAEISIREADEVLNSLMDSAKHDYESFYEEIVQTSKPEYESLVNTAEAERKAAEQGL